MSKNQKYITQKVANDSLPSAVSEKYQIVHWGQKRASLRFVLSPFGHVNFKELSLSRAEQLVKMEFPYLAPKSAK